MLFFGKKKKHTKEKDTIYSKKITGFGNIYCPTVTYEEDKIDLSKVPDKYVNRMTYDGYNILPDKGLISLEFSMCLLNPDMENVWGDISLTKHFTIETKEELDYNLAPNLSSNRIRLTDMFPFRMTSMFYKDDYGYYFYAKCDNSLGIYVCIHLDFKSYIYMCHVISCLCYRLPIEHKALISHIFIKEMTKFTRVSFVNKFKLINFSIANGAETMWFNIEVNDIHCLYFAKIDISELKKFVSAAISHRRYLVPQESFKYINSLYKKDIPVFFLDNPIKCDYLKDMNNNDRDSIQTSYYFTEDLRKFIPVEENTDTTCKCIQFDEPAINSIQEYIKEFINDELKKKVNIE